MSGVQGAAERASAAIVTVLGAGTMGRGIAQVAAASGLVGRLFDVDPGQLARARADIERATEKRVGQGKLAPADAAGLLERLELAGTLEHACRGAAFVIEAVPEDMLLKADVLRRARACAPDDALLASNTSSLSITELGHRVGRPEQVIGLHFFNPPPAMPLLEIVRGLATGAGAVERSLSLAARLGKSAIVVHDSPGFATSRLGVLLGAEAIRMLESGVASVEDIDRAMELGYRHPMGPLKLGDLVGLDVRLAVLEHLHQEIGEQFRPPALLRQMVRAGWLGKKVGQGFYRWTEEGATPTDPRRLG
jgi:3-hydroxybutyryl-CoA dehydrogenase